MQLIRISINSSSVGVCPAVGAGSGMNAKSDMCTVVAGKELQKAAADSDIKPKGTFIARETGLRFEILH